MYQEIHTHNIAERAYAPEIGGLLERFRRHAMPGAGAPHDIFTQELMPLYGADLMVMQPYGAGDYAYRYFGRNIARNVGCDRTGQLVSSMSTPTARFTIDCYDRALDTGEPVHTIHRALKTTRITLWERLILPTATAQGERFLVVFSKPLQFAEELLATVLDTSPAGILALRAIRSDEGEIVRAVVITANRRALAIAGEPEGGLLDADAREALPFFADDALWRRCLHVIELRRNDVIETCCTVNGREIWLQIAVAPFGEGLVMSLNDISELKLANLALQSRAATLALEVSRERATRRALSQELGQREAREQELRRLAETDPLTALLNRRSLIEKANAVIAGGDAAGEEISLFVVDLDHFKQINDGHGHAAGDAVIRAFADLLLGHMRANSLVSRLGGEEFAVVLPRAGASEALRIAERFQALLRATHLPVTEDFDLQVTASIGVATRLPGEDFSAFLARADKALYRAKHDGRNCVRRAEHPLSAAA
jgi:diguanylate cyclase (GGDEF)-like protein